MPVLVGATSCESDLQSLKCWGLLGVDRMIAVHGDVLLADAVGDAVFVREESGDPGVEGRRRVIIG